VSKLERNNVYQRFYAIVDSIPRGRVATYGQVARIAGLPRHARHVGHALGALPKGSELAWFRVLNGQGRISPRPTAGYAEQKRRLRADGVEVDARGRVDLKRYLWDGA